jgi:SpoVK/Ycf46/Vps4 family AAA+-type ATPase
MEQLDKLIGLDEVKEQVRRITAFARMKKAMGEVGSKQLSMALNMEFTGNPGTAKTTVARILAGLFNEIGLLNSSDIVEVGRSDLVAGYVGQTAKKVKDVFAKAKGRLLFIDEAYTLLECRKNDFGDEAIDTIVQEMENHREETIVIFAGYPDKMAEFFERNPGLRSRVPFSINFKDYESETLAEISAMEASKRGFDISEEAYGKVISLCGEASKKPGFGNGRFCRNLVENAILNYAYRKYQDDASEVNPDLLILDTSDFQMPQGFDRTKVEKKFGFAG